MTDPKPAPPRDDAELAARIDAATRPAAWSPAERARFRAAVEERLERPRAWRWLALGGALAAAAALAISVRTPSPAPALAPQPAVAAASAEPAQDLASEAFLETYDEEVLFAPEWTEASAPALGADVVPDDYRTAAALLAL